MIGEKIAENAFGRALQIVSNTEKISFFGIGGEVRAGVAGGEIELVMVADAVAIAD